MKTFVKILIGIGVVIAIPFVIALFVKNDYAIEREITINKPTQEVFSYIKFLKNQDHYNKWVMMDPHMKKDFKGTDGSVGFVYAWDGNDEAGKGDQEIKEIDEGKNMIVEIHFIKPFAGIAHTAISTEPVGASQTRVNWEMKGSNPYPMNFMNLFMGGMLGKDLTTSLENLKGILEK